MYKLYILLLVINIYSRLTLSFFLSDTLISSQNSFEKLRERTWVNKADKRKKMDIIKVQPKICSIVFQNREVFRDYGV